MRAMVYLAENEREGPQTLSRIARCGMSFDYLEQLLGTLRRQGLIKTVRGNQGGYFLARPAKDITLYEIITAVDGPIITDLCEDGKQPCQNQDACGVSRTWDLIAGGIKQAMNRYSLGDMLNQAQGAPILEDE